MNTRDLSTDLLGELILNVNISTDLSVNTQPMQVGAPNLSNNFGILLAMSSYIDGDYVLTLEESDDGAGGWTPIPAERQQGTFPAITGLPLVPTPIIGAFDTKSYVRGVLTSSNVTTGANFTLIGLYNRTVAPMTFLTP